MDKDKIRRRIMGLAIFVIWLFMVPQTMLIAFITFGIKKGWKQFCIHTLTMYAVARHGVR